MRVAVLGAGSWGTAIAILLARNGHDVVLAGRNAEEIAAVKSLRENIRYLPGFPLPENAVPCLFEELTGGFGCYVIAVPSSAVRATCQFIAGDSSLVVCAAKGLEPGTSALLSEVIKEECPGARIGAISGPNLAVELARGIPTAAVVAFEEERDADIVRALFAGPSYRVYVSDDVRGVELAGALKNVIAIGAGMTDGLGFGDNTKGAFIARGLREMVTLGCAAGARLETFFGIAGVGDLFATANSKLSRNYRVGFGLGQGLSLQKVLDEVGQTAEGVFTCEAALALARRFGIQLHIFEAIQSVLSGRTRPRDAVTLLMERMTKHENAIPVTNA